MTAGIFPERFGAELGALLTCRAAVGVLVVLFVAAAFTLRTYRLGDESLGEDEYNKLQTVEEYRANGLSGKNGEHPFLMKGLQTLSVSAADRINAATAPTAAISPEFALRFPIAHFGSLTTLLLFLLFRE